MAVEYVGKRAILIGVEYDLTGEQVDGKQQAWCGGDDLPARQNVGLMHAACQSIGYKCLDMAGAVTSADVRRAVRDAVRELWASGLESTTTTSLLLYICAHGKRPLRELPIDRTGTAAAAFHEEITDEMLPSFYLTERDEELPLRQLLGLIVKNYEKRFESESSGGDGPPPLHTTLVVDACYAGAAVGLQHCFTSDFPADYGITVMAACPSDNVAWFDADQHGYFTVAVSKWLHTSTGLFERNASAHLAKYNKARFGRSALADLESDSDDSTDTVDEAKARAVAEVKAIFGDSAEVERLYNESNFDALRKKHERLVEFVGMGGSEHRVRIAFKLGRVLKALIDTEVAPWHGADRGQFDPCEFCRDSEQAIQKTYDELYTAALACDIRKPSDPSVVASNRAMLNTLSVGRAGGRLAPDCKIRWSQVLTSSYSATGRDGSAIRHSFTSLG